MACDNSFIYMLGITGIGALALVGADVPSLMGVIGASAAGPVAKFAVGFPLLYHYLGGVRHVVWDKLPDATLNNADVEKSSYGLYGISIAVSAALAFVSI